MRSELRLSDLERKKTPSKLMNVKVPADVSKAIDRIARELGSSKTATVIALLNEGLDVLQETTPSVSRAKAKPPRRTPRRGRPRGS